MPIIVRRRQNPSTLSFRAPLTATATTSRRRRSEETARRLAPVITEIRKAGHHGNAEIAKCLNNQGLLAPSGGPFSRETVRRIQLDMKQYGFGEQPRTRSAALRARHHNWRVLEAKKFAELRERRKREHPEWDI